MKHKRIKKNPIKERQQMPEQKKRKYRVTGKVIDARFKTLTAKCPHKDKDGIECAGFLTTTIQEKQTGTNRLRITHDPMACQVFEGGGVVNMICGICDSLLEVQKSSIVTAAEARAQTEQQLAAAVKRGKVRLVK